MMQHASISTPCQKGPSRFTVKALQVMTWIWKIKVNFLLHKSAEWAGEIPKTLKTVSVSRVWTYESTDILLIQGLQDQFFWIANYVHPHLLNLLENKFELALRIHHPLTFTEKVIQTLTFFCSPRGKSLGPQRLWIIHMPYAWDGASVGAHLKNSI